ncbi:hypothetical protein LCGC14_2363300 [marine sediment metagenome]|uniref:Major facilitator superfamily (MFS) profile domain-containing protein n=1 Tax=marine sediment metagenome TaxID=412755 RepID=A0A0F9F0Q3_9ZZZZ
MARVMVKAGQVGLLVGVMMMCWGILAAILWGTDEWLRAVGFLGALIAMVGLLVNGFSIFFPGRPRER